MATAHGCATRTAWVLGGRRRIVGPEAGRGRGSASRAGSGGCPGQSCLLLRSASWAHAVVLRWAAVSITADPRPWHALGPPKSPGGEGACEAVMSGAQHRSADRGGTNGIWRWFASPRTMHASPAHLQCLGRSEGGGPSERRSVVRRQLEFALRRLDRCGRRHRSQGRSPLRRRRQAVGHRPRRPGRLHQEIDSRRSKRRRATRHRHRRARHGSRRLGRAQGHHDAPTLDGAQHHLVDTHGFDRPRRRDGGTGPIQLPARLAHGHERQAAGRVGMHHGSAQLNDGRVVCPCCLDASNDKHGACEPHLTQEMRERWVGNARKGHGFGMAKRRTRLFSLWSRFPSVQVPGRTESQLKGTTFYGRCARATVAPAPLET